MKTNKRLNINDVLKSGEKAKKAFIERKKSDESEKGQIIKKVGEIFFEKYFKNIDKELIAELRRKITDISLAQMVNFALAKKECPWLNVPKKKWDCGKSGCVKGGETYCKTIDFINCPAINHYFKNQISTKLAIKIKQQRLKRKK